MRGNKEKPHGQQSASRDCEGASLGILVGDTRALPTAREHSQEEGPRQNPTCRHLHLGLAAPRFGNTALGFLLWPLSRLSRRCGSRPASARSHSQRQQDSGRAAKGLRIAGKAVSPGGVLRPQADTCCPPWFYQATSQGHRKGDALHQSPPQAVLPGAAPREAEPSPQLLPLARASANRSPWVREGPGTVGRLIPPPLSHHRTQTSREAGVLAPTELTLMGSVPSRSLWHRPQPLPGLKYLSKCSRWPCLPAPTEPPSNLPPAVGPSSKATPLLTPEP